MIATSHSEWIKLRSVRMTWGAVVCALMLMICMSLVLSASIAASAANGYDVTLAAPEAAANGAILAQLPLIMIATFVITGEYASGTIGTTLRGTPHRGQLLFAKTLVVAALSFGCGLVLTAVGTFASWLALGDSGSLSLADAVRTGLGVSAYLALVTALTIGIGTIVRSTVVTVLIMILLLLAAPTLMEFSSADLILAAKEYLPSTAGEVLRSDATDPYPAGIGAVVLSVWAVVSLLIGYAMLWVRDA